MIALFQTVLALLLLAPAPLPAAQALAGPRLAQAKAGKTVKVDFDSTPLYKVVKWMSRTTSRNFIVEDALKKRRITIVSAHGVSVDEAYQAFLAALQAEGLYASEQGPFVRITSRPMPGRVVERVELAPPACPALDGVRQVDDVTWTVSPQTLDAWLGDVACMSRQARIIPSFKDGKAQGFKLFSIRPGSFYQAAGIRNGDVILSINGQPLDSPDHALEIYASLKKTKTIEVQLLRRGQPRKHTYRLE